jgi:hypothetical protein
MNPLRWDVLLVGLVFCLPVLVMGLREDLSVDQMIGRLPWCLLAGWVVVGLVRAAMTPPPEPAKPGPAQRIGCSDFARVDAGVVGEFDGRIKDGRLVRPGAEAGDVAFEEQRREDAIRDEGWGVVRWTWPDISRPERLGARVRRALDRGARDRP